MSKPPDRLVAGRVGPAHGLDGSFKVLDAVLTLLPLGATVVIGGQERVIERLAGHERRVILRLEGMTGRKDAEALRGAELWVQRTMAPPLGEDEWWAEELEGCSVSDGGRAIGIVTSLRALPSCEVLVVERSEGGELLVPLVSDAVRTVDVRGRSIDVDLQFLGEA